MKNKKAKYDFNKDKLEFLTSDYSEVKAFFQHKYGTYNTHITRNTSGRTKEKESYVADRLKQAKQETTEKSKETWKEMFIRMDECKLLCVSKLIERVEKHGDDMSPDDIIKVLKVFDLLEANKQVEQDSMVFFGLPPSPFQDGTLTRKEREKKGQGRETSES